MRASVWTCLALVGAARAWAAPSPGLEAAVLPPEAQVARATHVQGAEAVRLRAARGEREPALVAIRAPESGLLAAHATALTGARGAVIPAASVELDRVGWEPTTRGELPDSLEPCTAPVPVNPNENLLLWVEVAVPRDAAPGHYRGQLQLATAHGSRNVPLEVEVLPFTLPRTPSLATSFPPEQSGAVGAFARVALQERVTLRLAQPPPFRVKPLEGTLLLDFTDFDRALAPFRGDVAVRPSSIAIDVPEDVPAPRRLEYLLAVKRHLASRGMGELLVNFGEEGGQLRGVQGGHLGQGMALVAARDDGPRSGEFWWRLGPGAQGDTADWLERGAHGYTVRSLGWAAFHAGAVGLYAQDPLSLLGQSPSGEPRPTVRLKLLRKGLEDYELLLLAARRDPVKARKLAARVLAPDYGLPRRPVDFDAARAEVLRLAGHAPAMIRR